MDQIHRDKVQLQATIETQRHDFEFRASNCSAPFGKVDCDDRAFRDEDLRGPPLLAVAEGT